MCCASHHLHARQTFSSLTNVIRALPPTVPSPCLCEARQDEEHASRALTETPSELSPNAINYFLDRSLAWPASFCRNCRAVSSYFSCAPASILAGAVCPAPRTRRLTIHSPFLPMPFRLQLVVGAQLLLNVQMCSASTFAHSTPLLTRLRTTIHSHLLALPFHPSSRSFLRLAIR